MIRENSINVSLPTILAMFGVVQHILLLSLLVSASEMTGTKVSRARDGHRCGICPTYFQKVCAFDRDSKQTTIFDNHCIMDLVNCLEDTHYIPMPHSKCMYTGNFAYVHGSNYDDDE